MTAEGELVGLLLKEPVPPGMSATDTVRAIRQHQLDPRRGAS